MYLRPSKPLKISPSQLKWTCQTPLQILPPVWRLRENRLRNTLARPRPQMSLAWIYRCLITNILMPRLLSHPHLSQSVLSYRRSVATTGCSKNSDFSWLGLLLLLLASCSYSSMDNVIPHGPQGSPSTLSCRGFLQHSGSAF